MSSSSVQELQGMPFPQWPGITLPGHGIMNQYISVMFYSIWDYEYRDPNEILRRNYHSEWKLLIELNIL